MPVLLGSLLALCACAGGPERSHEKNDAPEPANQLAAAPRADVELESCRAGIRALEAEPDLPGAPELEARRAEVLGRARGEPMLFVREPVAAEPIEKPGFQRVKALETQHRRDRPALRQSLLREGYVYSSDPHEALALVSLLDLPKLFDEQTIHLQRGENVFELRRQDGRFPSYRHPDGRTAELLFGDRVAVSRADLETPLHRDLRSLARRIGFERARIKRRGENSLLLELRLGGAWFSALVKSQGAHLTIDCFDAPLEDRQRIARFMDADAARRKALDALHVAIDASVAEALPFDRPRDEKTAERDGQLRPQWRWAYHRGQSWFSHEEASYPVFDAQGRPLPPQMCVDFVLDSYERAAGTWFRPKGSEAGRAIGTLDFDSLGIKNRASVLSFEKFASENPELFVHRRLAAEERIQFRERSRFFGYLVAEADRFRPGDIVAIHGLKGDGLVHQHAILIEDVDPITGFPDALADQMKRPRRRTWEGIMAEAPLRSLLFHVRPTDKVVLASTERADAH